jgi:hypothetical protein
MARSARNSYDVESIVADSRRTQVVLRRNQVGGDAGGAMHLFNEVRDIVRVVTFRE